MSTRNDIPASAFRPVERPLLDTSWPRGQCAECGCADLFLYVGRSGKVDACECCYWEHAYEKAYSEVERLRAELDRRTEGADYWNHRMAEEHARAQELVTEVDRLRAALEELAHNHDSYTEVGRIVRNALENRDDRHTAAHE